MVPHDFVIPPIIVTPPPASEQVEESGSDDGGARNPPVAPATDGQNLLKVFQKAVPALD